MMWDKKGAPQKGWSCDGVTDLGTPDGSCQMCGREEIRFVHHISHPHFPEGLDVGCVCAEKMEDDYVNPRRREQDLRNVAGRRKRWLTRKWRLSQSGNTYIKSDGFHIVIYQQADGSWGGRITDLANGSAVSSRKYYPDAETAKLGAFDGMAFLKGRKSARGGRNA